MKSRAYIIIETVEGKEKRVADILSRKPGIIAVDLVDGPPDIVIIAEAEESYRLAEQTIQALISVEDLTNSVQCLPIKKDIVKPFMEQCNYGKKSKQRTISYSSIPCGSGIN